MFRMSDEEKLKAISGFRRNPEYIEVDCGCTSKKYGDYVGKLRIFTNGKFIISCECTADCKAENLTPSGFEKHAEREGGKNWGSHIWVTIGGHKVKLRKTVLFDYYKLASNESESSSLSGKRIFHRDELIQCTRCKKERKFRMQSKEECRIYHDALNDETWECFQYPYEEIDCDAIEERTSRKKYRGCQRAPRCKGCTKCVCMGCLMCRFSDCDCRTCVDFMENAKP